MTRYGTPSEVRFCRSCCMSNQRPSSVVERSNTGGPKPTLGFNADGICAACEYQHHIDHLIDWEQRDRELRELCNQYRSKAGHIDCIVPGSGGKDSCFAAHVLATRYGMHPLTVTWAPMIWTEVGRRNYERWASMFPHRLMERDEATHRKLTRLAFENLCHPFQPFIVGQRHCAAKVAIELGVPFACYGEPPSQNAGPVSECYEPRMARRFYSADNEDDANPANLFLGGVSGVDLMNEHGIAEDNLLPYCPVTDDEADRVGLDFVYLGHFLRWDPMATYYYAQRECGFECNDVRTEGSFSKAASIDDAMDVMHYFSTLQKFGIGRATYDASQEVRWGHRTREEAVALVRKYDQEFPARYWHQCLAYMDIAEADALRILRDARAPHLWDGDTLRHAVWKEPVNA